jgi:2-oxoglutarate ferredoxin oxidoreductase subunit gamma
MEKSVVFAGFGGQGVLFAGQLLAHAAADAGLHVTWIPSYGPEMRGGTSNCTVVVGDEPIGSPLVRHPDMVVAMNLPSTDKYEPLVKPGGVLIVNGSLVKRPIERDDIQVIVIPANEMAEKLGSQRMANVVMLGALLEAGELLVSMEEMEEAIRKYLPKRHAHLLEANVQALHAGAAFVRDTLAVPA